jgi:hypothetical protein
MATSTPKDSSPFTAAFEQYSEARDELLAVARKAGALYIDAYEQAVGQALELEGELRKSVPQKWLQRLIEAHMDVSRKFADSYVATARGVLN